MLVLLPPSQGKAHGGDGPPLDLSALSHPRLTPVRERLVEALVRAATSDPERLRLALGCTAAQGAEVRACAALRTAATRPALARYNGVLYDHLGYGSLTTSGRRRADAVLVVASALFGLLRPRDRVPTYRLPAGKTLPGIGSLVAAWRPVLAPELEAARGLVIDLRSGAYAALAPVPSAVQVRVLRERDGRRSTVSHDNKWTKGRLARALCEHVARSVPDVAALGREVADDVEVDGRRVDLILHGLASAR